MDLAGPTPPSPTPTYYGMAAMHRNYQSALAVWQTSSIQDNDTGFKFNFSTYKSLISSVLNKTRNRCKI